MQRWSWHKCRYSEELLSKIAGRGVHVPVVRTFGMDHIGLDAAARLGTAAGNARYAPDSAADFTLMLVLVALRHCKAAVCQQNVNDYSLRGLEGRMLSSLAVGVVDTGALDAAVVQRLSGFGCEILATGHHVNPEVAKRAAYVSQGELFRASDVISFHVPATPANHHLVSRESLAEMKDGVVLVNTARPDFLDVSAHTEGIESGKIGALAMDVFEVGRESAISTVRETSFGTVTWHASGSSRIPCSRSTWRSARRRRSKRWSRPPSRRRMNSSRAEAPEAIDSVPKG